MGVIFTLTTILLAMLPVCGSNYVGVFSNYEFGLHQILQRMDFLEAQMLECTRKTEHLEQSQWHQENEIRLQASKIKHLESRAIMINENELKVKELQNKLNDALEIIEKLVKEVEMAKQETKFDNASSGQFQSCEKCEEHIQNQSLDHISGGSKTNQISANGEISGTISKMKRASGNTHVAFAVSIGGWNVYTLVAHQLLPFNVVLLNDGNGFDSQAKSFICPVTGIYFFTASITGSNHKFEASIIVDGEEKASITTGDSPNFQQGSNSVVSHCSRGQRAYVHAYHADHAIGTASDRFTLFSGFLITNLESESS